MPNIKSVEQFNLKSKQTYRGTFVFKYVCGDSIDLFSLIFLMLVTANFKYPSNKECAILYYL